MRAAPTSGLKLSRKLFIANVIGAVMAAAGVAGLASGKAVPLAMLDNPLMDWMLVAGGFALMGWFLVDLFKRIRAAQNCRTQQQNEGSDPNGSI